MCKIVAVALSFLLTRKREKYKHFAHNPIRAFIFHRFSIVENLTSSIMVKLFPLKLPQVWKQLSIVCFEGYFCRGIFSGPGVAFSQIIFWAYNRNRGLAPIDTRPGKTVKWSHLFVNISCALSICLCFLNYAEYFFNKEICKKCTPKRFLHIFQTNAL